MAGAGCSASDGGAEAAPAGPGSGSSGGVSGSSGGASGGTPGPAATVPVIIAPPPAPTATASGDSGAGVVEQACQHEIDATVRDFRKSFPDMERPFDIFQLLALTGDKGIVQPQLVSRFPAYARTSGGTSTTTGPLEFYAWYVDTPGVNQTLHVTLTLAEVSPGQFVYDSSAFFPIDGQGFGNEGNPHNFHFTTEVRSSFTYSGGEAFTFRGDDDLWMFVNGRLAIDLGGLHPAQAATVNMDAEAARLGLVVGQSYPMDIFHAERHTTESNFRIQTSIRCFKKVTPPPPPPPPVIM